MTKNLPKLTSEGRDQESFADAKNFFFAHQRSVKIVLFCDGIFVDIQCCPLEIFALKKTLIFLFFGIVA